MQSIKGLLTLDVQNEHDPEHNPLFSNPKIYDADGDLTRRWYVYWRIKAPDLTNKNRIENPQGFS